jgi:hypothetical protein
MATAFRIEFAFEAFSAHRTAVYDAETDTFFVEVGEPTPTVARPGTIEGTLLHYDRRTGEPRGITVFAFWQSFAQEHPQEAQALMSVSSRVDIVSPMDHLQFQARADKLIP